MSGEELLWLLLKALAVLVLVALNGFFVATEFALVKVRDTQLQPLIAVGNRRAQLARHIQQNLYSYLGATQLGVTLSSLALGWVGEPIFEALLHPVFDALGWVGDEWKRVRSIADFTVGFSVITFLHIVAGELAPKSFAIKKPLQGALWAAYPLHWFYVFAYPFTWVLNHSAVWLLRQAGIEMAADHDSVHSEEELRLMFDTAQRRAGGSQFGREIVLNALDLRQRVVREVMRPRGEITGLDTAAPLADCLERAEKTRYSRFPLCERGDVDRTLGVVHIKDLYAQRARARTASASWCRTGRAR